MRGFLGFNVGEEFARELESFVGGLPPDPFLRPVWVADFHVTVKFLSEFSSEVFLRALPALLELGPPPVGVLRAGRVALWPTVVALECEPSLEFREWHGRVNALLEAKGFIRERHPRFHPHVTLARRKGGGGGMRPGKLGDDTLVALEAAAESFAGRQVPLRALTLFQSQAEETGRKHRPILSPLYPSRDG